LQKALLLFDGYFLVKNAWPFQAEPLSFWSRIQTKSGVLQWFLNINQKKE